MKFKNIKIYSIFFYFITFVSFYSIVNAEDKIKFYFSNDSINGIKPSDAYETHNMGLRYFFNKDYIELDLGLVTPDMFEYENKYREANRSYGELIKITYASQEFNNRNMTLYFNFIAQGRYGIDKLQNLAHNIANFQVETDILEKVRMPDNEWFGFGINYQANIETFKNNKHNILLKGYIGTDKTAFAFGVDEQLYKGTNSIVNVLPNFEYIAYDNIVSADPVNANHRKFIPSLKIEYKYIYKNIEITLHEKISLPTIDSDERPYLLFGATFEFPIKF